jgi:hypothetical protein
MASFRSEVTPLNSKFKRGLEMFDVFGPPELSTFGYLVVVSSFSINPPSVLNIVDQGVGHQKHLGPLSQLSSRWARV